MPPKRGSVWLRERRCEPVPHDLVYVVHERQPCVTQLRGQLCELQERVSARYGHT